MSKFKVGAGIATLDLPCEEYPVMGYFDFYDAKYDDCNVRVIAIDNGEKRILFTAFDLSDIPEVPDFEKKIAEAVGVDAEDIIITVTHNHTSPSDRGALMSRFNRPSDEAIAAWRKKYFDFELNAVISASKDAIANLRPAKYGYGEISSRIAANEITRNPSIGYLCNKEGNGYVDDTLSVIKFVDEDDKLICVLMNHPCHATCAMEPDAQGRRVTSGNFPGITSRFVEDYYGGIVAAWTSGAAGNLHPLLGNFQYTYTDGYTMRPKLPAGAAFVLMEHTGRQHAVDAINCIDNIVEYSDEMFIGHSKNSIMLPTQTQANKNAGHRMGPMNVDYGNGVRSNQTEPAKPFAPIELIDNPERPAELKMEVLTLGDVAIVGLGCELFCQIGRDIKNAVPAKHTVVVTHTPGYVGDTPNAVGYIVDKSSVGSANGKLFRNLKPGFYDEMITENAVTLYGKSMEK